MDSQPKIQTEKKPPIQQDTAAFHHIVRSSGSHPVPHGQSNKTHEKGKAENERTEPQP